jgi:uncharacterized protein involved in exopolysaccharide biosynthesis
MSAVDTPVRHAAAPAELGERPAAPRAGARRGRRRPRGWRLVTVLLLLLLLPTGLAGGLSSLQPPTYAAQADILFEAGDSGSSDTVERQLATQQVLLLSRSAVAAAAAQVGLTHDDVLGAASVQVLEGSDVLRLQVEDGSRARARAIAQSLVTQYTQAVEQRVTDRRDQQQNVIDGQLSELTARLVEISDRIAQIAAVAQPSAALAAEQRGLESEAQTLRQQVADLQAGALSSNLDNLDAGVGRAEVLAPPTVLDQPVAPQPLRAAAGGALVGLALAFGLLAYVRQRQVREVRAREVGATASA